MNNLDAFRELVFSDEVKIGVIKDKAKQLISETKSGDLEELYQTITEIASTIMHQHTVRSSQKLRVLLYELMQADETFPKMRKADFKSFLDATYLDSGYDPTDPNDRVNRLTFLSSMIDTYCSMKLKRDNPKIPETEAAPSPVKIPKPSSPARPEGAEKTTVQGRKPSGEVTSKIVRLKKVITPGQPTEAGPASSPQTGGDVVTTGTSLREKMMLLQAAQQPKETKRTVEDYKGLQTDVRGKAKRIEEMLRNLKQRIRTEIVPRKVKEVKDSIAVEIKASKADVMRSASADDMRLLDKNLDEVFHEADAYLESFIKTDEEIKAKWEVIDEDVLQQIETDPALIFKIPEGMKIEKAYALLFVFCCFKKWRETMLDGDPASTFLNHYYYFGKYHKEVDSLFPPGTRFTTTKETESRRVLGNRSEPLTPGEYLRSLECALASKAGGNLPSFRNYCLNGPRNEEEILCPPPFAYVGGKRAAPPQQEPEFVKKYLKTS